MNDAKSKTKVTHKGHTWIYRSERDDENAELEFELDFLASLTTAERFRMVLDRSEALRKMPNRNGHIETPKIVRHL